MNKKRKGFSIPEIVVGLVIIGIMSGLGIAAGTSLQNKARVSVCTSDIDSMKTAIYTALLSHPEFGKYKDSSLPGDKLKPCMRVLNALNEELDETYRFEKVSGLTTDSISGGYGFTKTQRDPWGNPYGLYIYTDSCTTNYLAADNAADLYKDKDSVMTVVIMSAGKNGTGGPMGISGDNFDPVSGVITSAAEMVNNTDGIDDIGIILTLRNGEPMYATFGADSSDLGTLENLEWVFGVPTGGSTKATGKYVDFLAEDVAEKTSTKSGCIDVSGGLYDKNAIDSFKTSATPATYHVVGGWS